MSTNFNCFCFPAAQERVVWDRHKEKCCEQTLGAAEQCWAAVQERAVLANMLACALLRTTLCIFSA